MARDVDITVGADTSAFGAGMAELRNQVNAAGNEIKSSFASSFSVASLAAAAFTVEGLRSIIDHAHEIHHEAERFGIDAQQLQTIANAAKMDGISIEQVATAMNRLAIVTAKQMGSIEALGISTDYFLKLSPADRFYAIADALQKNGINTETYTAAVTLLGKRAGGELIPVLAQGSDAIKKLGASMGLMSDETIIALDRAHEAWNQLSNFFQVFGGGTLSILVNAFRTAYAGIINAGQILSADTVTTFRGIDAAMHFDWDGVKKAYADGVAEVQRLNAEMQKSTKDIWHPDKIKRGTQDVAADMEDIASAAAVAAATDNLANQEEKNRLAALSSEEKLQDLLQQRKGLAETLQTYSERGLLSDEEELKYKNDIAKLDGQIGQLERAKAAEQDAYNQKLSEELDTAEKSTEALTEQNKEAQLIVDGHADIARQMHDEFAIAQQIESVTEKINEAWSEGNQALAEQLTELRDQLEVQKQIARERENAQNRQNLVNSLQAQVAADPYAAAFAGPDIQGFLAKLGAAHLNWQQYKPQNAKEASYLDIIRHVMDTEAQQATLGRANQLVTQANQPRSVAGEISFLQGTAIPGVRSLINPSEPFNIAQQLNAQLQTLEQMLTQLQDLNKVVKPPPGG